VTPVRHFEGVRLMGPERIDPGRGKRFVERRMDLLGQRRGHARTGLLAAAGDDLALARRFEHRLPWEYRLDPAHALP
jgi:hypothetical protein